MNSRAAKEILGALAGGLAHEIKNPLSTVTINLTLLREDLEAALPNDLAVLQRVEVLQREVRRLDALLEEFLRFAAPRPPEKRRQELGVIVEETLEFIRPSLLRDGIEIASDLAFVEVSVDASLYKQALFNILLNAQQSMPQGGRLEVSARRQGNEAVVEVIDTGAGIEPADLPRVFDVYFTTCRSGTGLGLPTARRILEEHEGRILLTSEKGRGTRVQLILPAVA